MFYIDVITYSDRGITLINQKKWLDENGITDVKHTGTKAGIGFKPKQYNRWRFVDETDAFAFKLAWVE